MKTMELTKDDETSLERWRGDEYDAKNSEDEEVVPIEWKSRLCA